MQYLYLITLWYCYLYLSNTSEYFFHLKSSSDWVYKLLNKLYKVYLKLFCRWQQALVYQQGPYFPKDGKKQKNKKKTQDDPKIHLTYLIKLKRYFPKAS